MLGKSPQLALLSLPPSRRNYGDIELLFQLLRAFTGRFLCNMTFLKEYMEEEIPKNYSIAQKRALFFYFVDFSDPNFGDELKAKVSPTVTRRSRGCWSLCSALPVLVPGSNAEGVGGRAVVGKHGVVQQQAGAGEQHVSFLVFPFSKWKLLG